jgi:division protein CdvB (Snf7/Vps24/ESCRT-III family)
MSRVPDSTEDETKERVCPNIEDFKPKLDFAVARLGARIRWLENENKNYLERIAVLTRKAEAHSKNDLAIANVFLCELAEKYKITEIATHSKLALDQAKLKLAAISDIKNLIDETNVALEVLDKIKVRLSGIYPISKNLLEEDMKLLSDMISAIQGNANSDSRTVDYEVMKDEAEKIITETEEEAKQQLKTVYYELVAELNRANDS